MNAATLLRRYKTFCVLCKRPIPRKRQRRRAITCKTKHQQMLTAMRKAERDRRQCSHCGRPSTPDERVQFRAFRTSQVQGQRKRNPKAAKGILAPAEANKKLKEIAYVVVERPKRRGATGRRKGSAA